MSAEFLPGLLATYAILLVAASSPGPAVAMLLGVATNQGRAAALVTTWGIATGATRDGGPVVVLLFVAGAFAISFGCHAAWALLLPSGPVRASHCRARRGVEGALGTFFAFAAFKMATTRTT